MNRPFSAACERNREPILAALREWFTDRRQVLEIGSGTAHSARRAFRHRDAASALAGLRARGTAVRPPPLVGRGRAAEHAGAARTGRLRGPYDAAFTANTLHIMAWEEVARMFERLANVLAPGGPLAVYGPFHRDGRPTSPSNAAFDAWLRAQSAHLGVRDAAAVDALARPHGFALQRGAGDAGAQPAAPVAARRALTPARCRARLDGPALFRRGSLR